MVLSYRKMMVSSCLVPDWNVNVLSGSCTRKCWHWSYLVLLLLKGRASIYHDFTARSRNVIIRFRSFFQRLSSVVLYTKEMTSIIRSLIVHCRATIVDEAYVIGYSWSHYYHRPLLVLIYTSKIILFVVSLTVPNINVIVRFWSYCKWHECHCSYTKYSSSFVLGLILHERYGIGHLWSYSTWKRWYHSFLVLLCKKEMGLVILDISRRHLCINSFFLSNCIRQKYHSSFLVSLYMI